MNLQELVVKLKLDNKAFNRSLQDSEKKVSGFATNLKSQFNSIGTALTNLGGKFTLAFTLPIVAGAGLAVKAFSDLEQAAGAVNAVFGKSSSIILAASSEAARSIGLTKAEFLQAGAEIGAMLTGMGFSQEEAAVAAIKLTNRAADMAAQFGGPTSQAIGAFLSLLRGSGEPMERFGVKITAADITARAFSDTLNSLARASLSARSATLSLQQAQQNLSNLVKGSISTVLERRQALISLERAQRSLNEVNRNSISVAISREQTTINLARAQANLNKLIEEGETSDVDRKQAVLDVDVAQRELNKVMWDGNATLLERRQAAIDLEKAQDRLREIDEVSTSTSLDHKQAVLDVKKAQEELKNSVEDSKTADLERKQALLDVDVAQKNLNDTMGTDGVTSGLAYQQAVLAVEMAQLGLSEALQGTNRAAETHEKALAALELAYEGTETSEGAFARETETVEGKLKIQKALIGDLSAEIGLKLAPTLLDVLGVFDDLLTTFVNLDPTTQNIILGIAGIAAVVGPLLIVLGSLALVIGAIGLPVIGVIAIIAGLIAIGWMLANSWDEIITWLSGLFERGINGIKGFIQGLLDSLGEIKDKILDAIPEWMIPGSPTPFEIGLKGIRKEFVKVNASIDPTNLPNIFSTSGSDNIADKQGDAIDYNKMARTIAHELQLVMG